MVPFLHHPLPCPAPAPFSYPTSPIQALHIGGLCQALGSRAQEGQASRGNLLPFLNPLVIPSLHPPLATPLTSKQSLLFSFLPTQTLIPSVSIHPPPHIKHSHNSHSQRPPSTALTTDDLLHRRRRLGTSSIILSLFWLAAAPVPRAVATTAVSAFLPTNSNRILHPFTASRLSLLKTFATVPAVSRDLDKSMDYARAMTDTLEQHKLPLRTDRDLDPLLESIGDKRFVFLGEASHGTHEFYTWRAHITKRLIEEKGFNFVAVEGDWPDCFELNRYIKGFKDAAKHPSDVMKTYFKRWPVWMWGNWEVAALAGWMRQHNLKKTGSLQERVGFYGLDVYSLLESLEAILAYMRDVDGEEAIQTAERALACFERVAVMGKEDVGQAYGMAATLTPYSCRNEVVELLVKVRQEAAKLAGKPHDEEAAEYNLSAELNTKVRRVVNKGLQTCFSISWPVNAESAPPFTIWLPNPTLTPFSHSLLGLPSPFLLPGGA